MTSRPRQWLDTCLLYVLFVIARPIPRRGLLALGRAVGSFAWGVTRSRRAVVMDNLTQAFGDRMSKEELRRLGREFYRNLGMTLMEFLTFPRLRPADFLSLVDIQGEGHLQQLQQQGRGAVFVSGHFGNWELLAARAAAAGMGISVAVKSQSNQRVDRLQNAIRRRAGVGILRTEAGVKGMVKALREGQMVAMLSDQDAGAGGHFTTFLGRQASVFKGPAYFAWKLGVPMVTVFIYRQPGGRHLIVVDPPCEADPAWDERTAVARLTDWHVRRLEDAVAKAPEQYFWLHRRWKTRPPAAPDAG